MTAHRAGELDEAAGLYEEALSVEPDNFDARHMLGVVRLQQTRAGEALDHLVAALLIQPDQVSALMHCALAHEKIGGFATALGLFDRALERAPNHAATLNNRAKLLMSLGRTAEALVGFGRALEVEPQFVDACFNRGVALAKMGLYDEARQQYDRALALVPAYTPALVNKADLLKRARDFAGALACLEVAAQATPRDSAVLSNRADLLLALRRPQEALEACDAALALQPERHEALNNKGAALLQLLRPHEALASFDYAIAVRPDGAEAHFNRGMTLALLGRLPEAWPEMEWRRKTPDRFGLKALDRPEWSGVVPIAGKTLFVHWEQGLGDTLQFCRFLPALKSAGATILFSVQESLQGLLRTLDADLEFIGESEVPIAFDFHAALLSLPLALSVDDEAIRRQTRYLRADPQRVERWRAKLGSGALNIGICWQGSQLGIEMGKSAMLDAFQAFARIPGARLISLQKTPPSSPPAWIETLGEDFDAGPDGFLDTAAVMETLDLVVTVDTSVAHLAGALGRPVWVVLKHSPDWRWRLGRSDSPWYPTMTLFRQSRADDWLEVGRRAAAELSRRRQYGLPLDKGF